MARDPVAILGPRIRARREAAGWSQARLAEEAGTSANFVGMVERGETLPSLPTLFVIAKVLGTDAGTLLGAGTPADATVWQAELLAVAATVPAAQRLLVLELVRTVAIAGQRRRSGRR